MFVASSRATNCCSELSSTANNQHPEPTFFSIKNPSLKAGLIKSGLSKKKTVEISNLNLLPIKKKKKVFLPAPLDHLNSSVRSDPVAKRPQVPGRNQGLPMRRLSLYNEKLYTSRSCYMFFCIICCWYRSCNRNVKLMTFLLRHRVTNMS